MLKSASIYRRLLALSGNTSRIIIFIIDLVLATISFTTACLLVFEFDLAAHGESIWKGLSLLIVFRIIASYIFQTNSLIIRFIGEKDLRKVVYAVLGASLAFLLIVQLWPDVFPERRFKALILVDFLLVLILMGGFRVFLRMSADLLSRNRKDTSRQNTLVYGAGELGAMIERVLRNNHNHSYKIVAIVDDDPKLHGQQLNGIRIYDRNRVFPDLIHQLQVQVAIIGINRIEEKSRLEFINQCLDENVRVLKIPASETWINGDLSIGQLRAINYEDLLSRPPIVLDVEKIHKSLKDRVILVTGCAGSIGSEIVRQLLTYNPAQIIGLDHAETPLADFDLSLGRGNCFKPVIGSIQDEQFVEQLFKTYRPTIVFHAAAYKHVKVMEAYPSEAIKTNINGTRIVADLASKYDVDKFVMISTDKVVNPSSVMGASKRIAEIYVQSLNSVPENQTQFITTRFGNVLGSNGSVVPIFKAKIENRLPIQVTHPEVTRFFMTIPEACQLVLEAGVIGKGGEILVFDMGEPVRILDLANKMIRMAGLVPHQDVPIIFTGLRPGEKLHEELLASGEGLKPTHHPKILKAAVRTQVYEEVNYITGLLVHTTSTGASPEMLIRMMQDMVPEYTPPHLPRKSELPTIRH
ncbi:MAG: polysaccharide biosynthesis protein [Saprospiraceae bacterium]|nr:polysaccharide biosynthesis protein [Saprospiraceae bacterium]